MIASVKNRNYYYSAILILFWIAVFYEVYTFLLPGAVYENPFYMALCSILICVLAVCLDIYNNTSTKVVTPEFIEFNSSPIFLIGSGFIGIIMISVIQEFPPNIKQCDIIPHIQILSQRWLRGDFVYTPVSDFGYTIFPNYLPFRWMPFIIADVVKIDYRWIAYFVFLISIIFYNQFLKKNCLSQIEFAIKQLIPFVLFYFIVVYQRFEFGVTIEFLDVGYYLLLAYAILGSSNFFRALALCMCLLSRFSLVLWVPLFILIIFLTEKKKDAYIVSGMTALLILVTYVIPFLIKDVSAFKAGYDYYTVCALGEWGGKVGKK